MNTILLAALLAIPLVQSAPAPAPPKPAAAADQHTTPQGWTAIFNGRDLDGWKPFLPGGEDPAGTWSVADGVLVCTGRPIGYIRTEKTYRNFELTLEWRFDPAKGAGNSGVLLRVQEPDKVWPTSIEAQLHSGNAGDIWNIGEFPMDTAKERTNGRRTIKEHASSEKPLGEWNRYRIVMDGTELKLFVNNVLQNVASNCKTVPGFIALQSEGAAIEFRRIELREIEGSGKSATTAID